DECLTDAFDRARSGTHLYSDKEPGLALIELPTWLALRPGSDPAHWPEFSLRLWGVRVLSVGLCFLVCVTPAVRESSERRRPPRFAHGRGARPPCRPPDPGAQPRACAPRRSHPATRARPR